MKKKLIYAFYASLFVPCFSWSADYLAGLSNANVEKISATYLVYDAVLLEQTPADKLQYRLQHDWRLCGNKLILEETKNMVVTNNENSARRPVTSSYSYGALGFTTDRLTNGTGEIERQMSRIGSSNWIPPLPKENTAWTRSCPSIGCLIEGNPFMKKYDGIYRIEKAGTLIFKGEECIKFKYELDAPFDTWIAANKSDEVPEPESLFCLRQEWNVSGFLFLHKNTGLIFAKQEQCKIKIVQMVRQTVDDVWHVKHVNADNVSSRVWVMDSVTTKYR